MFIIGNHWISGQIFSRRYSSLLKLWGNPLQNQKIAAAQLWYNWSVSHYLLCCQDWLAFPYLDLNHGISCRSTISRVRSEKISKLFPSCLALVLCAEWFFRHTMVTTLCRACWKNLQPSHRYDITSWTKEIIKAVSSLERLKLRTICFCKTRSIFNKHCLSLAIGARYQVMKRKRKLNDGLKPGKWTIPGPHFFHHNAAMTGSKCMHYPSW